MSKVIDITDKLNFEESPKLVIKGEEFEVSDRAVDILKITPIMQKEGGIGSDEIKLLYETLFPPESRERIEKLGLNMDDFNTVIWEAAKLIVGGYEGEAPTPATT